MKNFKIPCVLSLGLVLGVISVGLAEESPGTRVYLIGNSLTWDTVPERLAGDVQWHVDCGASLPGIFAKPEKPCVKSSTLWPIALRDKQFDVISVQPHYGSTLAKDVETISAWMKLQPKAAFVLHTGWARHAQVAQEFKGAASPDQMTHSPAYMRALAAELRRLHPGRELRSSLAQNLLAMIEEDIAAKKAPIGKLADLYRDDIHMTHAAGRYLMHNAMRSALGQPFSSAGFEKVDPEVKKYLDGILAHLKTAPADKALIKQILSIEEGVDRAGLIARVSDKELQSKLKSLLPTIEQGAAARRSYQPLESAVKDAGGRVVFVPAGPHWLYLAAGDPDLDIFDGPVAIDMYNGNNPLKKQGERNELVTDAWLEKLAALKGVDGVRRLDLANCAIRGDGLRHVAHWAGLRDLNLTLSPVTDDALKHLGDLTDLRTLGLASTQCTGAGFVHLKGLKKLESVNFHFTPLNDEGLEAIAQVPISGRLWFAHTKFTDKGAAFLASQTQLKRCGIGSTSKDSSGEAVAALSKLPLEELALLDNQATPAGIAHAAKIATLRRFDISHAPTVGNESLKLLAQMPNLEELRIGSARADDEGLESLAGLKSLKKLFLSGMKGMTPAGIDRLKKSRPDIEVEVK